MTTKILNPTNDTTLTRADLTRRPRRLRRSEGIRALVRDVLSELNRSLGKLYASEGRPSCCRCSTAFGRNAS